MSITTAKRRLADAVRPARVVLRKEIGLAVTDAVGSRQSDLEVELRDIKRVLHDDMDAANEATAVFGRLISAMGDRLDEIQERLDQIAARLDQLEAPGRTGAPARPPARQRKPAGSADRSG